MTPPGGTVNGQNWSSRKAALNDGEHIAWFDYAKGICIILVVMMHSTLGVGITFAERGLAAEGFMHWIVYYATPFRMPDFFMLAGLFLSLAIGRGWLHYLDKKVVHFAYFYVIWAVIQISIKTVATGGLDAGALVSNFADALISPYAPLWFIYVLPLFFVATKLLRAVPGPIMLAAAAVAHTIPIHTGWSAIDHFAAPYYVFFLAGYLLAPAIFQAANWAKANTGKALTVVAAWAVLNGVLVFTASPFAGWETAADLPVVSVVLGLMGGLAIVLLASQLEKFDIARFVRYCGRNSIVLYISFTIPMAITRVVLLKTGLITDTGIASMMVWLVALTVPLVVHLVLKRTPLRLLYERPSWISLPYRKPASSRALSLV
ncbi:MAG: acyltransferase family protein [Alphaproteobacteria bacterium]|nr:acyltransferase family protein [Alphaproteobacteria bacterium]